MRASRIRNILFFLIVLLLAGCSLHRSRVPDEPVEMPEAYSDAAPGREPALSAGDISDHISGWWESFGDEGLNALMEEAFTGNLDLSAAFERLNQARRRVTQSTAPLLPALGVSGSVGRGKRLGVTADSFSLSAAASYELDLWGKLRARREAAVYDSLATRAELKSIYISLSAEVADLYFLVKERRAQLELSDRTIEAFEETLSRVEERYRAGIVPPLDVYQSRRNLSSATARRPVFEAALEVAEHAVAVLLGRMPVEFSIEGSDIPVPPDFSAGLPSHLLTHRPDIEAAMMRLRAADMRVAASVADRFPTINLVSEYGGASEELKDLLDSPNIIWNLAAHLAEPIFEGGKRKAEVERTEHVVREELADYRRTVLTALKEVEDALTRNRATAERIERLRERVEAAEGAMRLALDEYLQGLSDYLPVLDSQQRLFDSKSELLIASRELVSHRVELFRSLGGGWAEEEIKDRYGTKSVGKEEER